MLKRRPVWADGRQNVRSGSLSGSYVVSNEAPMSHHVGVGGLPYHLFCPTRPTNLIVFVSFHALSALFFFSLTKVDLFHGGCSLCIRCE